MALESSAPVHRRVLRREPLVWTSLIAVTLLALAAGYAAGGPTPTMHADAIFACRRRRPACACRGLDCRRTRRSAAWPSSALALRPPRAARRDLAGHVRSSRAIRSAGRDGGGAFGWSTLAASRTFAGYVCSCSSAGYSSPARDAAFPRLLSRSGAGPLLFPWCAGGRCGRPCHGTRARLSQPTAAAVVEPRSCLRDADRRAGQGRTRDASIDLRNRVPVRLLLASLAARLGAKWLHERGRQETCSNGRLAAALLECAVLIRSILPHLYLHCPIVRLVR